MAVKDNVSVSGEPMRSGSAATPDSPRPAEHEVVRRLRDAGAVVVGITAMPELGIWATTEGAFGITRNPWNLERTPGGSSGGSAAAVASAMVPVAHGNDGLGSIRIPAGACGLVGVKPGPGLVPAEVEASGWRGMAENGALATTVHDAALVLSVMAGRPDLRAPRPPDRPWRIAVSVRAPLPWIRIDGEFRAATRATGRLLAGSGHRVQAADPPYTAGLARAGLPWWWALVAEEAEALRDTGELDPGKLQPRSRRHVAAGRRALRLGLVRERDREAWQRRAERFFTTFDLLLTPTLARPPIRALAWHRRAWVGNVAANSTYAPLTAPWNLARYPAASVPAGMHSSGVPISVQLVAPPGREALILSVARQLEELRPWRRHAPISGVR